MRCLGRIASLAIAVGSVAWAGPARGEALGLPGPPPAIARAVRLAVVARGLKQPVALAVAPGDRAGRLFVAEKGGRVRLLVDGRVVRRPFVDLSARVSHGAEQGLLGIAFHPDHARNRKLYLNFIDRTGTTQVIELQVDPGDRDRADPATERAVLTIPQPSPNHNGGHLAFGPDGKLYVGTGDGSADGDPRGHAQSRRSLLGKMLRLDVDQPEAPPETLQRGLRNPWRYAFDGKTGDLYIADVGQDHYQEINVAAADHLEGRNFGWSVVEGMGHCLKRKGCPDKRYDPPVLEYAKEVGCAVTGGHVYRGRALPALEGAYFYADFCQPVLRSFRYREGKLVDHWDWYRALDPQRRLSQLTSFGVDGSGELYLVSLEGSIFKLVPSGAPASAPAVPPAPRPASPRR